MKKPKEKKDCNYPSLYDAFELGDRVKRLYKKDGRSMIYKGIVLAIEDNCMEIYWDTLDGKYRPQNMGVAFTNCEVFEIFEGNKSYSPIKKDRA